MARARKIHTCLECGETFNHGIGLRKHQRHTGHRRSVVKPVPSGASAEGENEESVPQEQQRRPAQIGIRVSEIERMEKENSRKLKEQPALRELCARPVYTGNAKRSIQSCLPPLL